MQNLCPMHAGMTDDKWPCEKSSRYGSTVLGSNMPGYWLTLWSQISLLQPVLCCICCILLPLPNTHAACSAESLGAPRKDRLLHPAQPQRPRACVARFWSLRSPSLAAAGSVPPPARWKDQPHLCHATAVPRCRSPQCQFPRTPTPAF